MRWCGGIYAVSGRSWRILSLLRLTHWRKRQQVIVVLKDMQARGQSINIGEKPLLAKVGTYLGFWVLP